MTKADGAKGADVKGNTYDVDVEWVPTEYRGFLPNGAVMHVTRKGWSWHWRVSHAENWGEGVYDSGETEELEDAKDAAYEFGAGSS